MSTNSDNVWKALSHPIRREIVRFLADSQRSTGDIVAHIEGQTRFNVIRHLDQLRSAGLVETRKAGRVRINTLRKSALSETIEYFMSGLGFETRPERTEATPNRISEINKSKKRRRFGRG